MPLKKEIEGFDATQYFKGVSEECLDANYWGLISVVLGNKKNQRKLCDDIWMDFKATSKTTLKKYIKGSSVRVCLKIFDVKYRLSIV